MINEVHRDSVFPRHQLSTATSARTLPGVKMSDAASLSAEKEVVRKVLALLLRGVARAA
jgi:hypothetical protein